MAFKFLQNHPILAFILALLFTHEFLYTDFAASGGRMGGSSFSSEEETSSYSSSDSYDVYHYHYGQPGYSRGYGSYDDNSRRVNAEPKRENNMNKNGKGFFSWFALLPFGIFVGFLLWIICTYNTAASVVKIQVFNPRFSSGYVDDDIDSLRVNEKHEDTTTGAWFFVLPFGSFVGIYLLIAYLNRTSVLRVQVGLSGMVHSIRRELSTLSTAVDTSDNKSYHFFLKASAVALLRHQNCWISGYSSVVWSCNLEAVKKEFRQLSTDEKLKYDIVDSMRVVEENYIVVTILVAVKGALNLPEINSTEDLKTALHSLNTISSSNTLAVEVLWSPQAEHDTLSKDELLENYPLLRPI